jgi:hypothetical protein
MSHFYGAVMGLPNGIGKRCRPPGLLLPALRVSGRTLGNATFRGYLDKAMRLLFLYLELRLKRRPKFLFTILEVPDIAIKFW